MNIPYFKRNNKEVKIIYEQNIATSKISKQTILCLDSNNFNFISLSIVKALDDSDREELLDEELSELIPNYDKSNYSIKYLVISSDKLNEELIIFILEKEKMQQFIDRIESKIISVIPSLFLPLINNKENNFINLDISKNSIFISFYIEKKLIYFTKINKDFEELKAVLTLSQESFNFSFETIIISGIFQINDFNFLKNNNLIFLKPEKITRPRDEHNFLSNDLDKFNESNFSLDKYIILLASLYIISSIVYIVIVFQIDKQNLLISELYSSNSEITKNIEFKKNEIKSITKEIEDLNKEESETFKPTYLNEILDKIYQVIVEDIRIKTIEYTRDGTLNIVATSSSFSNYISQLKNIESSNLFIIKNHDFILNKDSLYTFQLELILKKED